MKRSFTAPPRRFSWIGPFLMLLTLAGCMFVNDAAAQDQQEEGLQMPADPSVWLNSPPITTEMLEGKAAVLYFFEET